jgi:aminoglycoside 3-N-acetyltransferase I
MIHKLDSRDLNLLDAMLTLFREAFDEPDTYDSAHPNSDYPQKLLSNELFVALVAVKGERVVGGPAGYELPKVEQERSEFCIYDLEVSAEDRNEGIATTLIDEFREIAATRGAYAVFVQADYGDEPAIALYTRTWRAGRRNALRHCCRPIANSSRQIISPQAGIDLNTTLTLLQTGRSARCQ